MENFKFYPQAVPLEWDDIEIAPVVEHDGYCERVEDGNDHNFWSVYLHLPEGGCECIADVPDVDTAHDLAELITRLRQNKHERNK